MAKFEKKEKGGAPEWMGTYGDLVTLLLCFFIMLFATAEVSEEKYKVLLEAFNPSVFESTGADSIIGESNTEGNKELSEFLSEELAYQSELTGLSTNLQEFISKENLDEAVDVILDNDKITLRLNSNLLFSSGKAELKDAVKPQLKTLMSSVPSDFLVQIEGHTDNIPTNNSSFASNWELSVMRGVNVLKYIQHNCNIDASRLSAAGYGEYRPVADNSTEQGRITNRRVDIILFKQDKSESKK